MTVQIILMTIFSLTSVLVSYIFCLGLGKVLSPLVSLAMGFDFILSITPVNAFVSFVISAFGVIFICSPLLSNELKASAATLLMPEVKVESNLVPIFLLLLEFFILCVFFSHSFVIGGAFFGVVTGASAFVFFGGSKFLKVLERKLRRKYIE